MGMGANLIISYTITGTTPTLTLRLVTVVMATWGQWDMTTAIGFLEATTKMFVIDG